MEVSVYEKASFLALQPLTYRQSWASGPQRPPVVTPENCSGRWRTRRDAVFTLYLKVFFFTVLTVGLIRTVYELYTTELFPPNDFWRRAAQNIYRLWASLHPEGIVFFVVFTVVVLVMGVFVRMRMRKKKVPPHQREEVKTISGLLGV